MNGITSEAPTRSAIWAVLIFSAFSHILNLASPLFVMHVYDRVLATRSISTLLLLAGIFAFLLIVAGLLDFFRGRILARLTNGIEVALMPRLSERIFSRAGASGPQDLPLEDLQAIRMALTGNPGGALLDAPWTLIYVALAFLLHPVIGWVAVVSAVLIGLLILFAQRRHTHEQARLRQSQLESLSTMRDYGIKAELARSLGAHVEIARRWERQRRREIARQTEIVDQNVLLGSLTKTLRVLVQIAILGFAAWLTIRQEMTGGAIFASSIIVSRALMPLEIAASSWQIFARGFAAWRRLSATEPPARETRHSRIDDPVTEVSAHGLYAGAASAGRPFLKEISFRLAKGDVLAVAGPVGCGKTLLCRLLSGASAPLAGTLRVNGMDVETMDPAEYGRRIGYLPQLPEFFPGTIAENISRFSPDAAHDDIVAAARAAGMHETISSLAAGYDTALTQSALSAGQLQLLSLARLAYGSPSFLILDTPESALDPDSLKQVENVLQQAIEREAIVLLVSHHPRLLRFATSVALMSEGRFARVMSADEFFRRASGAVSGVHAIAPKRD